METETIIQRLAFAKYLIYKGNQEANNSEPLSSVSILHYHDALELTFDLILEDKGINSNNLSFMICFDKINKWLKNNNESEISLRPSLEKLKNRRVNLKHKGLFPSQNDIRESEFVANALFEELCKNLYNLDIRNISLISLIENKKIKNYLSKAIEQYPEDLENSTINMALAFGYLLKDYESSKTKWTSPFNFGKDMSKYRMHSYPSDVVSEFMTDAQETIESMKKTLKILAYGLDYKKYIKFRLLIPEARWIGKSGPYVNTYSDTEIGESDFEFCINYIIECAFKLQEFDFEISKETN